MKRTKRLLIFSMTILLVSACGTNQEKQTSANKKTKVPAQKMEKEKAQTKKMDERPHATSEEQSLISEEQLNKDDQKASIGEAKQKNQQDKKTENKEKNVKQKDKATEEVEVASQKDKVTEPIKASENAIIKNSNEAIQLLQQYLHTENNEELIYSQVGDTLLKDEKGQYYYIKEIVKKIKENGGSGTAGLYKVYEDGTVKSNN